jgi:hypothetical protein
MGTVTCRWVDITKLIHFLKCLSNQANFKMILKLDEPTVATIQGYNSLLNKITTIVFYFPILGGCLTIQGNLAFGYIQYF